MADAIAPTERLTPLQFGEQHRTYTKEGKSARWRSSETPWAREILDTLDEDSPFRRVVSPKGTQLGFTELGLIWTGQGIMQAQSCLIIQPSEAVAKRVVKTKFRPMLMSASVLQGAFPGRSADTSLHFSNAAVDIIFAGSNSPNNFAGMSMPRVMGDEVDRWAEELLKEGDPVDLLENRIAEYGFLGKMFLPSSPTVEGVSIVWREWLLSDMRVFECPCPKCGVKQQWLWENMDLASAQMRCVACAETSPEVDWKQIWGAGEWRATNLNPVRRDTAGFHLSTLYARMGQRTWAQLVQQYEAVVSSGLSARMQTFWNTILGLPWKVTEDALEVDSLRARLEPDMVKGVVPMGALLLTAGIDYQKNRIEIFVWGWGPKRERWLVDKVLIERLDGDGKMRSAASVAAQMKAEALEKDWPHEAGGVLRIEMSQHDSSNLPADVFDILDNLPTGRNLGSKGLEGWGKTVHFTVPKIVDVRRDGKVVKLGRKLVNVYTAEAKRAWYDDLRRPLAEDGPSERYVHFGTWVDEEEGLLGQFVAEEIRKTTRGRLKWVPIQGVRNEGLDCAILGEGARWQLKSHRWSAEEWRRRAALVQQQATKAPPPGSTGGRRSRVRGRV